MKQLPNLKHHFWKTNADEDSLSFLRPSKWNKLTLQIDSTVDSIESTKKFEQHSHFLAQLAN